MAVKSLQKYLSDIIIAISTIEEIAADIHLTDLDKPEKRWALERGISIIEEALYQADKLQKDLPITNLHRIKTTRHIIVHEYDIVDKAQIFAIIKRHLPILKEEVTAILKNLSSN